MKYTEEEMQAKAKKVLKDIQKEYYKEENIAKTWFVKEDPIRGSQDKTQPCWIVSINEPVFDSSIFLTISDETGEPLYIQNKHGIREIENTSEGKYVTKK
jgi:hypothetical protein